MREPETAGGIRAGAFNSAGLWARKTTKLSDWGLMLSAEVQRRAMALATILEPLLIVAMGVVVMLIVLAVLLPIIQLNAWVK